MPNKVIPLEYSEETGNVYTGVNTSTKTKAYKLDNDEYKEFKETYGFEDSSKAKDTGESYEYSRSVTQPDGTRKGFDLTLKQREWTHEGVTYRVYYEYRKYWGDNYYIKDLTKISGDQTYYESSLARELQATISAWYVTLRNIAIVALLSVLVYIGIRITLSSVASDKAKYKQMLGDWMLAICLVFLMHYLMSFACTLNEKIIEAVSSISISNLYDESEVNKNAEYETGDGEPTEGIQGTEKYDKDEVVAGVELFEITDKDYVNKAEEVLIGEKGKESSFYNRFERDASDNPVKLLWPANDFMTQARLLGQNVGENVTQEGVAKAGYNIIYVVLVIYTIIFCFIYLKRVVYMAFLTMIAPLVAITYPIDKINDGKAQAFDLWFKEYIFNLLMQPMHLILYTILVGSAMRFAATNIFYVVVALGFLMPAEKLLRRFFGFEKAQTAGTFGAGAALGTGLMMSGLNKLMNPKSNSKGKLGAGGKDGDDKEEKPKIREKDFDETDALIGKDEDKDKPKYHKDLTDEQLDELKSEGLEPGDQEYEKYLRQHGIDPNKNTDSNSKNQNNKQAQTNKQVQTKKVNKKSGKKRRLVKPRRAIRRGLSHYGQGLVKRYKANKAANGGIIRRSLKTAGGLATGAVAGTAGALIGITTGDPSKAFQYATTGAVGGYALGKSGVDHVAGKVQVPGTMEAVKQGYYGDEYKEKQEEKFKKQFMRDNKNLERIEDKFDVNRREAKRIMDEEMKFYLDHGITNMDDMMATYGLEKDLNISKEQAVATERYANKVLNGKDTRYMTAKEKKEIEETFVPKFAERGSKNAEKDVKTLMKNLDTFHKLKE